MQIRKFTDRKPHILIFQGSPRRLNSCANQIPKSQIVAEYILEKWLPFADFEFIDLSVGKVNVQPCKGCISTANGMMCNWHCSCYSKDNIEKPDLYLTYYKNKKTLKFELSEELGGTKHLSKKFYPIQHKKIIWDGETQMNFLITDYNDPNLFFETISVKIKDLIGKSITFKNIDYAKFSIYTRRLFKYCIIEYK
jgi:hypothetical protein